VAPGEQSSGRALVKTLRTLDPQARAGFRGSDEAREGDIAGIQSARDRAYGSRAVGAVVARLSHVLSGGGKRRGHERDLGAHFRSPGAGAAVVAERDDRLIGFSHYLFQRSAWLLNPQCYLQDLYVGDDKRGRGVGRALIGGVAGAAKEAGATRVFWNTHETNAVARRLYDAVAERTGFIQYRIEPLS
jgi:GNAT superfamily N-acetyltransferase